MDSVLEARKKTPFLPHVLPKAHLGHSWRDKVPNNTVLERTGITSLYTLLKQTRLQWLGYISLVVALAINTDTSMCLETEDAKGSFLV